MRIHVGHIVAGKYELVRLLGRGSMGEVWVAHHRTLGEQVALKLLRTLPTGDHVEDPATATARFRFEAQVAARLSRRTRHIVRVTDHGEEDGIAYLVMELLDGQTLDAFLLSRGSMDIAEVPKLVAQIARALQEAQDEGVIHRDLKPANVFLTRDEDGQLLVKLLDFGIARAIHAQRVPPAFATARGLVFGTPGYMSPEQAIASSQLDHRCDLWALATVAYEALTGELPVPGANTDEILMNLCAGRLVPVRTLDPGLPDALAHFFDRAFAQRIDERYASASELATAFEHAASQPRNAEAEAPGDGGSSRARGGDTWLIPPRPQIDPSAPPPRRRAPSRLALAVAAAATLGLGVAGAAWHALSGPTRTVAIAPTESIPEPSAAARPASASPAIERLDPPESTAVPEAAAPLAVPAPRARPLPPAVLAPSVPAPTVPAKARKPLDKSEVL
jgi:serine/threonine-protein kinase